ncbi:hypothetical protein NX794_14860 [Streptomyces sp. LP11]|uniref:Lipoprotein n=1 Tax=Streptomyces pyxinicus TaxID=2970331 RepID=A0ABT2B1U4_9ACTN|nr:hypothetical protein [Streptomyces sp. LP11]MCS0602483.1 hypothetical protein [Streptomyces sp. LP11]
MRRTTLTALAATALLLTGCGSQSGSTGSGDNGKVSPSPTPPSDSASASRGACTDRADLTAADNGHSVCLTKGGEIRLTLDGTEGRPWKPVTASGGTLKAINAGLVLRPGDATAAFQAVTSGDAVLTSSRPLCAEPTATDQVSCKGIEEWRVTVRVG